MKTAIGSLVHCARVAGWLAASALAFVGTDIAHASDLVKTEHVTAQILMEDTSIQPAHTFAVGTRLTIQPGWHIYWINPGDAGVATAIRWSLPPGFTAGAIEWPYPTRLPAAGGEINYGYTNQVMLLSNLTAPADLRMGQSVTLGSHVSWLVCADVCIPGQADVSTSPTVSNSTPKPNSQWAQTFAQLRANLPAVTPDFKFSARLTDVGYQLIAAPTHAGVQLPNQAFFFGSDDLIVEPSAPQPITIQEGKLIGNIAKAAFAVDAPKQLRGVWVAAPDSWNGKSAVAIDIPLAPIAVAPLANPAPSRHQRPGD